MKTFITFSPQQPEGKLFLTEYEAADNQNLAYGPTRFPIIPVINGYAEPGEEIRVIVLCPDHDHCRHNLTYLEQELEELFLKKQLRAPGGARFQRVDVPWGDAVNIHIETFQKLIDLIRDGDELYACITYGSKPAPMVELLAMRYARQIKQNTYIGCVVYGGRDWKSGRTYIHDVTALAHLDDIIRVLAQNGDPNPKATLDSIISM